jgi:hypothetical protein
VQKYGFISVFQTGYKKCLILSCAQKIYRGGMRKGLELVPLKREQEYRRLISMNG